MATVSTPSPPVQVCDGCGDFVATLLVETEGGRRMLCEACALEAGTPSGIPIGTDEPSDAIPIDRAWIETWVPRLSLAEIRVYLWLACNSHSASARHPQTVRRLMRECALQRRTIQMSLDRLVAHGLLHRVLGSANERHYLIVRIASGGGSRQLSRVPPELRPQGRIPPQGSIPSGGGGDPTIAPLVNPESQGGVSRIAPLGGPEGSPPGGVLYSELPRGRDQTLPLGSSDQTCTDHPPRGGALSAPYSERPPSRSCGPSTHPPTPVRSSPAGSHSLSDPGRSSPGSRSSSHSGNGQPTPRVAWTGYRSRVVREVAQNLQLAAAQAGATCTPAEVEEFLKQGARQSWLQKKARDGSVSSPLHVWADPARFLRWLSRRLGGNHATRDRDVDAVRHAEAETRRYIARQAEALARGDGLAGKASHPRRKHGPKA